MKKLLPILFVLALAGSTRAQTVTYSEHIAPIIFGHCTSCHRTGEIAPFPLTNYAEISSWGSMIQYVTGIHFMPPWKPEINYQEYQRENYLSDGEIQQISDWVNQGMPQGNPALEPPLPVFPTGSQVGTPDVVVSFSQSYTHVGNNTDEYRYFVIPTGLTEQKDLVALEVRPGNKSIVHHCLVWADTSGDAAADDAATPEYGYEGGNAGLSALTGQLPGYVPGAKPNVYTHGIAQRLYPGTDLKLQMHYAPAASDETDSTTINLFFADQPATRFVKSNVMVPFFGTLTNGPFIIPANQVKDFHGTWTVPEEASMLGIAPHMHKLGVNWRVFAVKPDGDTVHLIRINEWDFNWQGAYMFNHMLHLPQGTVIHAYAKYDNTTANVNNPHSPPQTMSWGENTSDEMYYLPIMYLSYQTGDENIVFEESNMDIPEFHFITDELYPVAPNPSSDMVKIGFTLGSANSVTLRLYDYKGSLVQVLANNQSYLPGMHIRQLDVSALAAGLYTLELNLKDKKMTQKVMVSH